MSPDAWHYRSTSAFRGAACPRGWRVLETLVASTLATRSDSDIVQVIAEQIALGDAGTDCEQEEDHDHSNTEERSDTRRP